MAEETKPRLYTIDNDQYSYEDLSKSLDSGIQSYIGSLRRGDKDTDQFYDAYSNLMKGIADGTITYQNGRLVDRLGRYSNGVWYDDSGARQTSKKKSKDYYGLITNYIVRGLRRQKKYNEPKEEVQDSRIKWGNSAGSDALSSLFFVPGQNDELNLRYFIDLDPYDTNTQARGIGNRAGALRTFIENNFLGDNFDKTFQGYTDADKARFLQTAQRAYDALSDGTLDPGDRLAISRLFPNVDLDKMFYTGEALQTTSSQETQQGEQDDSTYNAFLDYIKQNHPLYEGELANPIIFSRMTMDQDTKATMQYIDKLSNDQLLKIRLDSLGNNNLKDYYLATLKHRGLLQESGLADEYIIPSTENANGTVYTYNPKTRTYSQRRMHELPYYQNKWKNDFDLQSENKYSKYFSQFKKNGGVIKAQTGVKLNSNTSYAQDVFSKNLPYILQQLKANGVDYAQWLNDMQSRHSEMMAQAGDNWQNQAVKSDLAKQYQDLYKSGYNNEFAKTPGGYNTLGISNATAAGRYDVSGPTRTSGDSAEREWVSDGLISGKNSDRTLLGRVGDFTPEQLAATKKELANVGFDMVAGADNYYRLNPLEQPAIQPATKVIADPNLPEITNPNILEDGNPAFTPSETSPTAEDDASSKWAQLGVAALGTIPDLIGAGRMIATKKNNNKVAEILKEAQKPVFEDTYQLISPVTGAYSEMQMRNRQAADVRTRAAQPFTSDASLQLAGQLSANRQATDLQYQGFLADDRRIKQTQEKAWQVQADNTQRRSVVANKNRQAIAEANKNIAEIEAARLKANHDAKDAYLQQIEGGLKSRLQNGISALASQSQSDLQSDYQSYISQLGEKYGGSQSELLANPDYVSDVQALRRWYGTQLGRVGAGGFYRSSTPMRSPAAILAGKHGMKFKPSIEYMINKVIHNENNS